MKIKMTKSMMGAADGFSTMEYTAGKSYDLGDEPRAVEMGGVFIREKAAIELTPEREAADAKAESAAAAKAEADRAAAREAKKAEAEAKKLAEAEALVAKKKADESAKHHQKPKPEIKADPAPAIPDPKSTAPQK